VSGLTIIKLVVAMFIFLWPYCVFHIRRSGDSYGEAFGIGFFMAITVTAFFSSIIGGLWFIFFYEVTP